ncbi:YchJ family protein [Nitrosococcus wardiae]|uniref:Zinc chelation protein SecC n=1 Tax=Nitrosococcus wardiae TaxID=1814290 RepID=A0A4P7C2U5_9GAMM|nr:YchJ family protein [Nitrosococcus wardiae]QBQ56017.1 zinc chelation protein SecC [Nitrosococcus wardiae]
MWQANNMQDEETDLDQTTKCICDSGMAYEECCGLYLSGEKYTPTAEALMRSRFTAFAIKDEAYILETWDPAKRPPKVDFPKTPIEWNRLEIVEKKKGGNKDTKGIVEFKAYYLLDNEEYVVNEISRFRKEQGRWYYLDGAVKSIAKVGQQTNTGKNAPCPCGSGKKYKRCCGKAKS